MEKDDLMAVPHNLTELESIKTALSQNSGVKFKDFFTKNIRFIELVVNPSKSPMHCLHHDCSRKV